MAGESHRRYVPGVTTRRLERRIRIWLILFIIGLVTAGLTAFPLEIELRWVVRSLHSWASPLGLADRGLLLRHHRNHSPAPRTRHDQTLGTVARIGEDD
jgi:hypothetical protein